MILTGRKLEEICKAVWGKGWESILAQLLGVHPKTIYRWRDDHPPADKREAIIQAIEDHMLTVAQYVNELRARYEEA